MNKKYFLLISLIGLLFLPDHAVKANKLVSNSRAEELRRLNQLKSDMDVLKLEAKNFYNYTLLCGGKQYESRVDRSFMDKTIPAKYKQFVFDTYKEPDSRPNLCPKWSNNLETKPKSGNMELLSIPENTKVGEKVYLLLAIDPESQPIYYFIRKAESESTDNDESSSDDDIIFRINVIRMGMSWFGEVILDKQLDYETKQTYNYLVYAYDGVNLLEKYSLIEVTDVDDEKPEIDTENNAMYNSVDKQFEFTIYENASVGEIINPGNNIIFRDVDTQNSQLTIRLINLETGLTDSPFTLNNNGEIRLTSKLDFESQKEYTLKINVQDVLGQFAEEIIKIDVWDVADLAPRFEIPKLSPNEYHLLKDNKNFELESDGYVIFYENKLGPVFNIKAVSSNEKPLGQIGYKLEKVIDKTYAHDYFEIVKHPSNDTWYLDCIKKISLDDKEEQLIEVVIRAIETSSNIAVSSFTSSAPKLFTDLRVIIKVINGDLCQPRFDKPVYEFSVVEGMKQLIEPIYVNDCDHGVNGRIYLSTTNEDFTFKIDQVYRFSKLGIEMQREFDYEDNITIHGHIIEFEIIARGSNQSLAKFETRSLVRVEILDINEFVPKFVLPQPAIILKDGYPTNQLQRIFTYNVAENVDFTLEVKAIDQDRSGDGELLYNVRYLHPDDNFIIKTSFNSSKNLFLVTVPGRYLDSNSRIPIVFAVYVEDYGEPKLRNEIIIYLRPQSVILKPAYFEFDRYEFKLAEHQSKSVPFELRLINDNLGRSKVTLEELYDPLNLLSIDFEENSVTKGDLIQLTMDEKFSNFDDNDIANDLFVYLSPTSYDRDLDEVYKLNNFSDTYEYKIRAKLVEKPELFTDVTVIVKLIDRNDNAPIVLNLADVNTGDIYLNATLNEDFIPNSLLNINNNYTILKFADFDFSPDFGLRSLYFRVNDSRFYVDNEHIARELENKNASSVSLLVRIMTSESKINKANEPVIWLKVTCEDNYFNRILGKSTDFNVRYIYVRIDVTDSIMKDRHELFDRDTFLFVVDENWTGSLGPLGSVKNLPVDYQIELHSSNNTDKLNFIKDHFKLIDNELVVEKPFDYEVGDHFFNFSVTATPAAGLFKIKTDIAVVVRDLNDETPKFTKDEYEFHLSKNEKLTTRHVGTVFTHDLDKEDARNLTVTSSDQKFAVTLVSMDEIAINAIQALTENEYTFEITAMDQAKHISKCRVKIFLESNRPFEELAWTTSDSETVSIRENSPENTSVTQVSMKPLGIKVTKYTVGYRIVDPTQFYQIDESTGKITTTRQSLDREETSSIRMAQQTRIFVQAYVDLDSTRYWSNIKLIRVEILDENDQYPVFVQPFDDETQVKPNSFENIYRFLATDSDLNDRITYSLIDQTLIYTNVSLRLPFKLNSRNGTLSLNVDELTRDNFKLLVKQSSSFIKIRFTVRATDRDSKSTDAIVFVELPISLFLRAAQVDGTKIMPISYELKPLVNKLQPIDKKVYSLDESTPVDTLIGELTLYTDNEEPGRKPEIFDNLKVHPAFNDSKNADLYFSYDPDKFSIKLIRKLDYDIVKNITLVLVGESDFKMDLEFVIKDDNNKVPRLELDREEQHKYGDNMVLVTVNDLRGLINSTVEAISSTPMPPRKPLPAIPELDLPVRPVSFEVYRTPELDARRQALSNFNDIREIKTYRIIDTDLDNNFTVSYVLNETSEIVPKLFDVKLDVEKNQVVFERRNDSAQLEAGLEKSAKNLVTIELADGVNTKRYHGELFPIYPKQLQRIFTYLPHNGRFKGQIYRSHVETQKINLEPIIQLENQFPYDIYLNLTGEFSKYFKVSPRVVKSSPINIAPTEIEISLREPIEKLKDVFDYVTVAELEVFMYTHNKYLNQLLNAIGPIEIKLDIRNENKYQPKVDGYSPKDKTIRLDEGTYSNYEIASITAYDRDRFDPGRLEYFMIGNSNLLEINRTTGVVYLNGELDAEADQPIVFFCYARDLAHQPFGVNSDLIEFKLYVNNVNEFEPLLQPVITSIILKESVESKSSNKLTIVDEFRFDCYDRDANSSLEITLDSVRYVSKFDSYRFIEDDRDKAEKYDLESLFRLVYDKNQTDMTSDTNQWSNQTRVDLKNYKTAYLAYTNKLDYELIYKPTETFIRLDVSCSDGQYESKSKVLIKVEDMNDNAPRFANKNLVIHRNESNLLQTLVKIEATDEDQSPEFGNYSLKYSIQKCEPNLYDIYIDQRTGVVNSRLIIDLDTEEIIKKRHAIMNLDTHDQDNVRRQIEFMSTFNKIKCQINVTDNNLYKSNQQQLSDTMNLTIIIDSVNDNAPEIDLDNDNPIEVREGENTRSLILQKIVVFDKDDATGLQCLFGNGLTTSEPFELKTVVQDSQTTLCIFKVRDDMIVDYDIMRKSFYLLELVVRDDFPPPVYPNKGVTRAQLRVRVIPVNNKPPVFVNGFHETFYVLDSIRPGTLVGSVLATDMENPNPDRIIYAFDKAIPGFASDKFALRQSFNSTNTYWGSVGLFTKAKLEVSESPYLIPVIAYDGPAELKDTLSSRKLIKVIVLNKGSMSVWSNSTTGLPVDYYSVDLAEEVAEKTPVVEVIATIPNDYHQSGSQLNDLDNIPVVYSLDEPNPFYQIDPISGQISTTGKRIDYEDTSADAQKQLRSLKVRASSPDAMFNYTTHVSVNLLDINDNAPRFESDSYQFYVVENSTHLVSPIGRVNAIDADSGLNGQVAYKLDSSEGLFTIDQHSGVLSVVDSRRIDRELNQTIQLNVIAHDMAGLSTNLTLTIEVLDVNDNAPTFDADLVRKYRVEENESNFSINLAASDADNGQNGTVFFYLDHEANSPDTLRHFRVDPLTGTVELITPLDYETKRKHRLFVTCSDNGSPQRLNSIAEFVIDVLDVNDNAPKFTANNQRRIRVNETTQAGDPIVQLEAVDLDETPAYRQIVYDIVNVAAFKNGVPVEEHSSKDVFKINPTDGRITLGANNLDVDLVNEYQVQVIATDKQNLIANFDRPTELTDTFNLTILVVPSNIKVPKFERPAPGWDSGEMPSVTLFRRSLSESQPREYVVDIVKAVDPNQYGIVYHLDSVEEVAKSNQTDEPTARHDNSGLFSVGADDGVIKARSRRSAYSGEAYKLSVRASSLLSPALSTTLKLLVKVDSNVDSLFDNRVVEKMLDENVPGGTFVYQLRPKIADINLEYQFNGDYSSPLDLYTKWFKIDSFSGVIRTQDNARIDCELIGEILLSVDVFDAVKHTLVENLLVKIKIRDLNDNAPVFEFNYNYEPVMREDDNTTVNIERLVTKFKANDADRTYENSALVYHIDSIQPHTITIGSSFKLFNHTNGEVSLIKLAGFNLDRDDPLIGDRVTFTIVCENTYDRSVHTRKLITLNLEDLNDQPPKFLHYEPVVELTLNEDYKLKEKFYHVKAIDADKPDTPNSQLIYSIAPTTSGVRIDSNGYLYLISSLDYETQPRLPLTITACDKSTQPLYANKNVIINVLNVNDNYPKFKNSDDCVIDVLENAPIGQVVRKFQATDLDSNSTDFIYKLKQIKASSGVELSSPMPFVLESVTGELRVNADLDREKIDSYAVSITVDDPEIRGVRLSTQMECSIRVLDVNDNKPQFDESSMRSYKILPVVNERTLIGAFRAHDPDLAENGTIEYSLVDDYEQLFSIDARKAVVVMNLVQNFDLNDVYELQIVASDAPGRPQSSATILPIAVRIDPNYFTFNQAKNDRLSLQVPELVHVYENSAVGTRIAKLNVDNSFHQVMDLQTDNQNQTQTSSRYVNLEYQLLTCNDTFRIDEKTGVIDIIDSSKLDYERVKEFLLVIKVKETQQMTTFTKTRTGTDRFMVKVLNLNDNPVRFNRQVYRANVPENSRELPLSVSLDELIQLSDDDLDMTGTSQTSALNQLYPIDLRLTGADSDSFRLVELGPNVYKLEAIERFDYEFKNRFDFELVASDGVHKSKAKVEINIQDVNDNKPIFEKPAYVFRVDENSAINTPVGLVHAIDLDLTPENNLTLYKLVGHGDSGHIWHETVTSAFGVNEKSGLIYVRDSSKLDREQTPVFNLTIMAYSPTRPSDSFDTTEVLVYLNDLNDQIPRFDSSLYQINIREKWTKLPRLIGRIHARDDDLDENGTINYYIERVNGETYPKRYAPQNKNTTQFYMDQSNGHIYLNAYLDLDRTDEQVTQSFELTVVAADMGGNKEKCTVIVSVIDVNDHDPVVLSPSESQYAFDENTPVPVALFELRAVDIDYRKPVISCWLDRDLNDQWKYFTIDAENRIVSQVQFDYETTKEYTLRIVCRDSGIMIDTETIELALVQSNSAMPNENTAELVVNDQKLFYPLERTTMKTVTIVVRDLDDNEPVFSQSDLYIVKNVSEYLQVHSTVTVIPMAHDPDTLPENCQVRYVIISGNEEGKFSLNATTGELLLEDELEISQRNVYELKIAATSRSGFNPSETVPAERSQLTLRLNILNDRRTIEFEQQDYSVSFKLEPSHEITRPLVESMQNIGSQVDDVLDAKSLDLINDLNLNVINNASLFYCKSHLIKRKMKRTVGYQIEMIKFIKYNEQAIVRLPKWYASSFDGRNGLSMTNAKWIFTIDELTGKVYGNRAALKQIGFKVGDRFILTIEAVSKNFYNDETENAITQLNIRLTEKDYTFMLPMKHVKVEKIVFEYLNPLKPGYLPRLLEADGIKVAVQDLVNSQSKASHYLFVQIETLNGRQSLNLDTLRNYTITNKYLNDFLEQIIEREPLSEGRKLEPDYGINFSGPFYTHWLFWLLFIIGLLLITILAFIVLCFKSNKKPFTPSKSNFSKKPGIIIEYPPGVNPIYNDGVLTLENKKRLSQKKSKIIEVEKQALQENEEKQIDYEEQEMELEMEEEMDE